MILAEASVVVVLIVVALCLRAIVGHIEAIWEKLTGVNDRLDKNETSLKDVVMYLDAIRAFLLATAKPTDVGRLWWAGGDEGGFVGVVCHCNGDDIRFVGVGRDRALTEREVEFVKANEERIWDILKWKMASRDVTSMSYDELIAALEAEEGDDGEPGEEAEEEDAGRPAV